MDHLVSRSIKPQVGVVLSTYDVTYFVNPRLSSDTTPSAYVHFNMEGRATLHLKGSLLATAQAGWSPISEPVTASLNQSRRLHMQPVDMDKITTWPSEVTTFLTTHSEELRFERKAHQNYTLSPSNFRIINEPPPMPRWSEAKALIESAMAERELIAFHATRLVDYRDVQKDGLLRLNLAQHVARLKKLLQSASAVDEVAEVDAAVTKMLQADSLFLKREGAVWATPHRASLHDGGCDVFFESFGGEALERIAGYARGKLERRLKQLGEPAVVIFRYPAYGWCKFTHARLPQSMIELHLHHESRWEAMDYGWDIMINQDVPAKNIVAVMPLDDLKVAL